MFEQRICVGECPVIPRPSPDPSITQVLFYVTWPSAEEVETVSFISVESFRFWDEYDYEYGISSKLRSARAWNSVILAGKRDSRRHSSASFSENFLEGTSYKLFNRLNYFAVKITVLIFLVEKMYNEAIRGVYYLRISEKTYWAKSRTRSRSRPRILRSLPSTKYIKDQRMR